MSSATISLIIFGVCIVFFIFTRIPLSVTAVFGLMAMILCNVCSFADGFRNFGASSVILISSMMIVGKASFQTGLAQTIGARVLSLAGNDERKLIVFGTVITAALSAFLSNIATLSIMIYMVTGICGSNKNVRFKNLIMPISIGAVLGGMITLIGSTPQLTAQGLLETYLGAGNGFRFFDFTIPGCLIVLMLVVFVGWIGYPLGKRIWGAREDYDEIPTASDASAAHEIRQEKQKIMSVIFFLTILLFVTSDWLSNYIPNFNIALVSISAASACILSGCISLEDAFRSVNWNLVVWLAASLGMAGALNSSGGGAMLANAFIGLFGTNVPANVLFVWFIVIAVVLTQFLSNSTVITILLPIAFSIASDLEYNPFALAVGITMASAVAVATPLANTTIAMSMVAKYKFNDYWKYAGIPTVLAIIIICIVVPLLYPLV